jgi:predicted ATPase
MISRIKIENFKPFKTVQSGLKELNILTGLNGMGKTSFIQAVLLLMQSSKLEQEIIELNGSLVQIGLGRDALYQFAQDEHISFGITIDGKEYIWKFVYKSDKEELHTENGYATVSLDDLCKLDRRRIQYISADRLGPQDLYDASTIVVSDKKQLGLLGEYAAYFINIHGNDYDVPEPIRHKSGTSDKLLSQVNAWLKEISPGVSLSTKYLPEVNKVILNYQFDLRHNKTNHFLPKNVGFGISYILPVILALLTAEKDKIIIIENPESHIHPRGQAEIGKLIALASGTGAQLFIETHSDHIINGIRVSIKENIINKDRVNIMFFDKVTTETEQYATIIPIRVDENGSLSDYPDNFMDEWSNQLSKLI